jgi:hypothetical protein
MSDKTRIVFAEDITPVEQNNTTQIGHWSKDFNHYLVSYGYMTPGQSNLVYNNLHPLEKHNDIQQEKIDLWIKPQTVFGEKVDFNDKLGINRYLSRVIYEEMFQISQPHGEGGAQITSAGGLLTHIDEDAQTSIKESKHANFLINASNKLRGELSIELNSKVTTDSALKIASALGIDIKDVPEKVEECFIKSWDILSNNILKVMSSKNEGEVSNYLRKLLAVRSLPEFQFLFRSPFHWITIEKNESQNPLSQLDSQQITDNICSRYKGELKTNYVLSKEEIFKQVERITKQFTRIFEINNVPLLSTMIYHEITKGSDAEIILEHPSQITTYRRIPNSANLFVAHEAHDHLWGGLIKKDRADFVDKIYITNINEIKQDIDNKRNPYRKLSGAVQLLR